MLLSLYIYISLSQQRTQSTHSPRIWDKVARSFEELVGLVNILHSELPDIWRETARWALLATLLVHRSTYEIGGGLRARIGSNAVNLFTVSLGLEVPRNLSSMFSLLENRNDTSAPMSYEHGLLDPSSLLDEGWVDPGIRVYVERGSNGSPEKGLVSIETVVCKGGETPKQAMESRSALDLQRRLQLPKPDEFRVMALAGYVENTNMRQVEILYHAPEWASPPYAPISLFRIAAENLLPASMGIRISIARKLACAVLHLHASDWIHGDIIDCNVMFFTSRGPQPRVPNLLEPFLCNFVPRPVQDSTKAGDVARARDEFRRARARDISQLAWVMLKLVLGDDAVRRLRGFEPTLQAGRTEFTTALSSAAMESMNRPGPVVLFEGAIMSCLCGIAALEGVISQDEAFASLTGFYWRVVRPLDHCLSLLLERPLSVLGSKKKCHRERMADVGQDKVPSPPHSMETALYIKLTEIIGTDTVQHSPWP